MALAARTSSFYTCFSFYLQGHGAIRYDEKFHIQQDGTDLESEFNIAKSNARNIRNNK